MYKSKFTLSDDTEEFEGYTDGSEWNGWANVCFTKEQICEFMKTTPYDFHFGVNKLTKIETLIIYWVVGEGETYHSTPLPTDEGDILVGFFLDGLEFMEVEEK